MLRAKNSDEKRCVYEMKNKKKLFRPAVAGKEHFSCRISQARSPSLAAIKTIA
jgi:hypothetical protein